MAAPQLTGPRRRATLGRGRDAEPEADADMHVIERIDIEGNPPPWGVTAIGGFVQSALRRVEREGAELPDEFCVSFCPWGERNAATLAMATIADVFEPRFRLVHFTSCGRPYLVAVLTGPDAVDRQCRTLDHLPWSEHYHARWEDGALRLTLVAEREDIGVEPPESLGERSLRQLFDSGDLQRF